MGNIFEIFINMFRNKRKALSNVIEIAIDEKYNPKSGFCDGLARVMIELGKWVYINIDGEEILSCECQKAENFSEGMACIKRKGRYGYINKEGKEVIPCIYDSAQKFENGIACVEKIDKISKVDNKGRAYEKNEIKYYYIDKEGNEVLSYTCDKAENFNEGMACINRNGLYGYINEKGEEVIPCRYFGAESFANGVALIKRNGKYGYINKKGEEVIPCIYNLAGSFSEGVACVSNKCGMYGYINTNGKMVIPCKYHSADELDRMNEKIDIDLCGCISITYKEGLSCDKFRDERVAIRKGDKWGYINKKGELVIPCSYDKVESFSRGFARVMNEGKWGYINREGEEVIPCIYDEAYDFYYGVSLAKKHGRWYIIKRMMTKKDLIKMMKQFKNDNMFYGFGNTLIDDVIMVGKNEKGVWEVFYSKRGKKKVYFETLSESCAYEFLYNYFYDYHNGLHMQRK